MPPVVGCVIFSHFRGVEYGEEDILICTLGREHEWGGIYRAKAGRCRWGLQFLELLTALRFCFTLSNHGLAFDFFLAVFLDNS